MTMYVVAMNHRVAQEWITREGLALAKPTIVSGASEALAKIHGLGPNSTIIVLNTPALGELSWEIEEHLSMYAQRGVPVIRLDPDYQHGDVAVRPVEPDFTPPEFDTAEEALEWLEKMEKVRQEVRGRTFRSRLSGEMVTMQKTPAWQILEDWEQTKKALQHITVPHSAQSIFITNADAP